jgi:hydrogenase expression/formation protein HypE
VWWTARRRRHSWRDSPNCWNGPTPSSASDALLKTGKLPPELLRSLVLGSLGVRRAETLVPAQLGVDAAVVAAEDDQWAWVLTCDPITTAVSGAGRLAVYVVCNDLAAMGAEPVGVLATLLFPAGTAPSAIAAITAEIDASARALNVEVLGGHTEVAPGLSAAVVVMTGIGKARRDRLLTAAGARPGDALVLTKAAALEGTHVLASDLSSRLLSLGVPEQVLLAARAYADELSVVPEARIAAELGATAMHDPTEAGVIGAVWEMAEASGCGFRIRAERIAVREPTRVICDALGVDPLRLIASGALLIACRGAAAMVRGLASHGIAARHIGNIRPAASGRILIHSDGREERITELGRDELYRVVEQHTTRQRTTRRGATV